MASVVVANVEGSFGAFYKHIIDVNLYIASNLAFKNFIN